jgi:hypothetical protein
MAEINEVYRIHEGEGWKDVDITSATGDVVGFTVSEVENIVGTEVGDVETSVDLSAVVSELLYDKDGVTTGKEAPDEEPEG